MGQVPPRLTSGWDCQLCSFKQKLLTSTLLWSWFFCAEFSIFASWSFFDLTCRWAIFNCRVGANCEQCRQWAMNVGTMKIKGSPWQPPTGHVRREQNSKRNRRCLEKGGPVWGQPWGWPSKQRVSKHVKGTTLQAIQVGQELATSGKVVGEGQPIQGALCENYREKRL